MRACATITVLSIELVQLGCRTTIRPPAAPERPVVVHLMDGGRHSSLLLPCEERAIYVEFAYGEWRWFALEHNGPLDAIPALLWPTPGTLGRAEWPRDTAAQDAEENAARSSAGVATFSLIVDGDAARALLDRLEARFEAALPTRIRNETYGLDFVELDDESYHAFHNCNHVTCEWLTELGCEVRGGMFADFVVVEPAAAPATATAAPGSGP